MPNAPVQMTRAEYQAKYGTPPPIPTTPTPSPVSASTSQTPIPMTHAEYMAKYGGTTQTLPDAYSPSQPFAGKPNAGTYIADAAKAGINKIKSGLAETQSPSMNPLLPLEAGTKIAAGAIETASSPLAPLFSPLGKLIGYVSDKIASHPAVQKFALSPAGEATSRVAENVGNLSTIAGAVAGTGESAPVENVLNSGVSKVADTTGNVTSQVLGASTGTGASSVKAAFNGGQAFIDAMRGKINPDQVIQTATDAVSNIADARRSAYLADLAKVGETTKSLDISPIQQTLTQKLSDYGIKVDSEGNLDFSRSSIANNGSARADVQGVFNTLKDWGSKQGDRTPIGLDTLKKQLSDFYSPSGSARALVQAVKAKVSDTLNSQVPGYKDMTSKYAATTQLLNDIKSATGIGGNSKPDTVFTKLTTAMKGDKEFRLQVMKEMQAQGAQPDLMAQIGGINMSSAIPKGLVGRGTDAAALTGILFHFFNPQVIPLLLATSPRVVGEFAHAMGLAKPAVSTIVGALTKYGAKAATGAAVAAPEANLKPQ